MSLTIAAWFRYLNGLDDQGNSIAIDDPMAGTLTQLARSAGSDPKQLLNLTEIFESLPQSSRFVDSVTNYLSSLYEFGAKETLAKFLPKQ